jgi:predicted ATP-grasp superfamily ATP-dependent carboligase
MYDIILTSFKILSRNLLEKLEKNLKLIDVICLLVSELELTQIARILKQNSTN